MVNQVSTKDHKGIEREVYRSQVLEGVHGMPPGARWRGQGRVQAERAGCRMEPTPY